MNNLRAAPHAPRKRTALLGTAALVAAMLAAPQANAATQGDGTPGLAGCINQIIASGHAEILKGNPTFTVGTNGDDGDPFNEFLESGIYCGRKGNDAFHNVYGHFVGGPGDDMASDKLSGLFLGGPGDDWAGWLHPMFYPDALFDGGPGNDTADEVDTVFKGGTGNDKAYINHGSFYGGPGNDTVADYNVGTFMGGMDSDSVEVNEMAGIVYGGAGNDTVKVNYGTFIGGPGYDVVLENHGTCKGVEVGC